MIYSGRLLFFMNFGLCKYMGVADRKESPYYFKNYVRKGRYKGMQKTTKATILKL